MISYRFLLAASLGIIYCNAQTVNVTPRFECVQRSFGIASFGYDNINAQSVSVAIGSNNFFLQFPLDRGQPTTFLSGDIYHAFLAQSDLTQGLTWGLQGGFADGDASPQSPTCPAAFIDPQLAPIGIVYGQTLRIKATGNSSGVCNLNIGVIGGPSKTITLSAGQIDFIDVALPPPGAAITGRNGARQEFVPFASVVSGNFQSCQVSAEVYNSQLGMTVTAEKPQFPQYQPVFDSQALVTGETLRVIATAPANSTCTGIVTFQDASGNSLGKPGAVNVTAGQFQYVDLPSRLVPELKAGAGTRAEILPQLVVPAPVLGASVSTCIVSAETFDSLSGDTRLIVAPEALP